MPGPAKLDQAARSMSEPARAGEAPGWLNVVGRENVKLVDGRIHVKQLPVLTRAELKSKIKNEYFSARGASVPKAIYKKLRVAVANVSERSVRRIVESLETYQLTKRVRQPPSNRGHRVWQSPGIIQADTTFLDKGWDKKVAILVMHDTWSSYTGAFVVDSENAVIANKAMLVFCKHLVSTYGVKPKVFMTDLGTEFANLKRGVAKRYKAEHLQSPTGKPIHEIEAKNSMLKRRIEIQRVAHKMDDAGALSGFLADILFDMNNTPRDWRAGYTPTQLLKMSRRQRAEVNARTKHKLVKADPMSGFNRKVIRVGDDVRRILWTTKDIINRPMGKKGYQRKWSKKIYKVLKIIKQKNNVIKMRIDDDTPRLYFRNELQKVNVKTLDEAVPVGTRPSGWDDQSMIITGTKVDDSKWGKTDEAYVPPAAVKPKTMAPRLRRSGRAKRVDYASVVNKYDTAFD